MSLAADRHSPRFVEGTEHPVATVTLNHVLAAGKDRHPLHEMTMSTTFTEVLPPQASSLHNAMTWVPGKQAGTGLLTVHTLRASMSYLVVEFPTSWDGRAFHLAKTNEGSDPGSESYDVFCGRNPRDCQCSCKGFAYGQGRPCKHIAAVSALLDNEALWGLQELVNPGQDVSNTEPPF